MWGAAAQWRIIRGADTAQLFYWYPSAAPELPLQQRGSSCDYSFHTVILDYIKPGILFNKPLNAAEGVNEANSIIKF